MRAASIPRRSPASSAARRPRRASRVCASSATVSALGIVGSMASGLFAYLEDGTDTKPLHPAWAAHGAIVAARLASFGAEGPPHVLEGRFGLYDAFLGARRPRPRRQLADLGTRWETPRIAYKPYPACHYIHGSLGATALARRPASTRPRSRRSSSTSRRGGRRARARAARRRSGRRASEYEAKFSLQYSTARMLVHGQVGVGSYTDEAIGDPRVLELATQGAATRSRSTRAPRLPSPAASASC